MSAQCHGLLIERTQSFVLDLVLAVQLLDHQLAVTIDDELFAAYFLGIFECFDEAGVFGDVVGGLAEIALAFDIGLAGAFDNISVGGGPGIAARAAVGEYR